jgi:hypothetical protein
MVLDDEPAEQCCWQALGEASMRGVPDGSRLRGLDHVPLARPLLRRLFSCPVLISALRRWTSSASPADVSRSASLSRRRRSSRVSTTSFSGMRGRLWT